MALIEWDESYSVKVNLIDRQHQRLFDHVRAYHKAVQDGRSKNALIKLLDELVEYAAVHFTTEERYFVQFSYEHTKEHKHEHKVLALKINDLKSKVKVGVNIDEDDVSNFLKVWLETHIKETDHKYIDCFTKGGLR